MNGVYRGIVVAALLGAATSGAASEAARPAGRPPKSERALRARVSDWWTAREARDHTRMYRLYDPGYRARVSEAEFGAESAVRSRFAMVSHDVVSIAFEGRDGARVRLSYRFLAPKLGNRPQEGMIEERWVRRRGEWYKEYRDFSVPEPFKATTPPPEGQAPAS